MDRDGCVILFLRAPERGRVKTRLAATVGADIALDLYRLFVEDTLAMLLEHGQPLLLFYDPPAARQRIARWLGSQQDLLPQRGADLGERMCDAFERVFARGFGAALLIGSDLPDLPGRIMDEARAALREHDTVLGPAEDGGYYLIGFRREGFLPAVFSGIPWSTPAVCTRTREILKGAGRRVHLLPPWRDVDTRADLEELIRRNRQTAFAASATMRYLGGNWPPAPALPEAERSSPAGRKNRER